MIYWKLGIHFGVTTKDGLKRLQEFDHRVRCISKFYFTILSLIKYIIMILLSLPVIFLLTIVNLCKVVTAICEKPINKYNNYFMK